MKITLARHSGFCMGVRNAILRVVREINSSDEELYVYGPLIHNPQTIDVLHGRGMRTAGALEDMRGKRAVIRTHGIPVQERSLLKECASSLINLTCPRVAKVQSIINKYSAMGHHTVITGDADHAEVAGLMSYASGNVTVLSDIGDTASLPVSDAYLVVSQTTFDRQLFKKIVGRIQARYQNVTVVDTICDATRDRQEDVSLGIMNGIDTLVVVGGKNSANTRRLAQIGRDSGIRTYHVETEEELNVEDFADSKSVLVTAGTSTPGWIINNVLERLFIINYKTANVFLKSLLFFLELVIRSNLLSSVAAFFMTLITLAYAGLPAEYPLAALTFLYIFSMYSVNNYFERNFLKLSNPNKYVIYEKFGILLLAASIVSLMLALYLATLYNPMTVVVVASSFALGFIYSTKPVRVIIGKTGPGLLRKFYNSRIITSFGWALITVLVPMLATTPSFPVMVSVSALIFTLIFLRTTLLDLIAFNGDLIMGRETLPVIFGVDRIRIVSMVLGAAGLLVYSAITATSQKWPFLLFAVNAVYYLSLMYAMRKFNYIISLKYELLVDLDLVVLIALYILIALLA
ncbi:MAG: 4-hydroxy-3-methylbut-2-enyl diphosphate reductase [Spirochaetes bacterium]|nr:4-hydroxy-3-methylbut-2-enyl diphosphate reductase [Spirochaetota bacterium]